MRISVLVPSFRRSRDLARCLGAIAAQSRAADQMLVIARDGDAETLAVAAEWCHRLPLEIVAVQAPGQVHALNAGLARCSGDIVAITDDDAAPFTDWLHRIEDHFASEPKLGAVGGRDWVHENGRLVSEEARLVGRFLWYGRGVGNHHLGVGPAREVDFLKGANCAFRLKAIAPIGFDVRLKGAGAQVHNDLAVCLRVKKAGWKILYDPLVAVDHFPAARFDADERHKFDAGAAANRRFNFRHAVNAGTPPFRRVAILAWLHLIGTKSDPGYLRVSLMVFTRDHAGLSRHREIRNLTAGKG